MTGTKPLQVQTVVDDFLANWFGDHVPADLQVGMYKGSGVGLSTGGDAVHLYDAAGALKASVTFGGSPGGPYPTFDNAAGLNGGIISNLSVLGVNGAFIAAMSADETGSPGRLFNAAPAFTSGASFDVAENTLLAATVMAHDPNGDGIVYALTGGDDQALFAIDGSTGAISFLGSPDFETPEDTGSDNAYELEVTATDIFGLAASQAVTINVTDVAEAATTVNGGNGNDAIDGTSGNNTIAAGNGDDTVHAGDGNDIVMGGNGRDVLFGGRGDDMLDGGNGKDILVGEGGDDVLTGGNASDWFVFDNTADTGDDVITDMANIDLILVKQVLSPADLALTGGVLNFAGGGSVEITGVQTLHYYGAVGFDGVAYHAYEVGSFA